MLRIASSSTTLSSSAEHFFSSNSSRFFRSTCGRLSEPRCSARYGGLTLSDMASTVDSDGELVLSAERRGPLYASPGLQLSQYASIASCSQRARAPQCSAEEPMSLSVVGIGVARQGHPAVYASLMHGEGKTVPSASRGVHKEPKSLKDTRSAAPFVESFMRSEQSVASNVIISYCTHSLQM
jgi:hypothetical protein